MCIPHLAGRGLAHHRLIRRREVSWIKGSRAIYGHPIDGAEGGVWKVQMQASVKQKQATDKILTDK